MPFREKWLEAVEKKNSVLCAGLDPAEFNMGRGEKGLPGLMSKLNWSDMYIRSVSPYVAAIKPNIQYWKRAGDLLKLLELCKLAHNLELLVIEDSKLADIGSTNDAGFFYGTLRADAVTFSPFAGNIEEAAQQAGKRDVGVIGMCLMSNPEYEIEKNKLVPLSTDAAQEYRAGDRILVDDVPHVKQYIYLANQSSKKGLDGIVVGAPSSKNHITSEELKNVYEYSNDEILVLLPGVGHQGGEAGEIWNHYGPERVIVNVGRALMFPQGSDSTSQDHAEAAKHYQKMLNELRAK